MAGDNKIKIISVLQSLKGNAHRALCFEIARDLFLIKLKTNHKEIGKISDAISGAKILLIEDINLSVSLMDNENKVTNYRNMDFYYAIYDVLSVMISNEVRLTQESFHTECDLMRIYSSPSYVKSGVVEIRQGLEKEEALGRIKKRKYNYKITKSGYHNMVETQFSGSVVGLFLLTFEEDVIALDFWNNEQVFGIMLNDYKVIPLKLNGTSYDKVCTVFGYTI